MNDVGFNATTEVNADETWDHEVTAHVPGSPPFNHTIEPDSGVVRISIENGDGTRSYWNGSAWVSGDPIDLATTIIGTRSRYPFLVPESADKKTILFEGWVVRNGKATPPVQRVVYVGGLGLAPGDVVFGTPQPL